MLHLQNQTGRVLKALREQVKQGASAARAPHLGLDGQKGNQDIRALAGIQRVARERPVPVKAKGMTGAAVQQPLEPKPPGPLVPGKIPLHARVQAGKFLHGVILEHKLSHPAPPGPYPAGW